MIVVLFADNPKVDRKDQSCVVMCSSNDGFLRAWCMIKGGGFIVAKVPFKMSDREEITEFIIDKTNSFLLTADGKGYVKLWDVSQLQHQVFQKLWVVPNLKEPKYSRPEFISQLFMWRAHHDAITRYFAKKLICPNPIAALRNSPHAQVLQRGFCGPFNSGFDGYYWLHRFQCQTLDAGGRRTRHFWYKFMEYQEQIDLVVNREHAGLRAPSIQKFRGGGVEAARLLGEGKRSFGPHQEARFRRLGHPRQRR